MIMIMLGVIITLLVFIIVLNTTLGIYFKRIVGFAAKKLASFAEVDFPAETEESVILSD